MSYTQQSSVDTDQAAYDRLAYFALRSELLFDQAADVQPTNQSMPGSSVIFTIFADLAEATSTLAETTDVTPVAMSDSQVTVTLAEYGNTINTTAKLRGTSFLDIDAAAANLIGYNAGDSIDKVVRDVLAGYYMGYIHPDVSYDLRRETGAASWNAPHVAVDTANIYNGEIGTFESVRFIETPRAKVFANASNGTQSVGTGSVATAASAKHRCVALSRHPALVQTPLNWRLVPHTCGVVESPRSATPLLYLV